MHQNNAARMPCLTSKSQKLKQGSFQKRFNEHLKKKKDASKTKDKKYTLIETWEKWPRSANIASAPNIVHNNFSA